MILLNLLLQLMVLLFAAGLLGIAFFMSGAAETFADPLFRWFMLFMVPVILYLTGKIKTPTEPPPADSAANQHPARIRN